jgi:hypothetical protein
VTPVGHREILKELQPALVIAAVTTLTVDGAAVRPARRRTWRPRSGCQKTRNSSDVIRAVLSLRYVAGAVIGSAFLYLLMLYGAYAYKVRLTTP